MIETPRVPGVRIRRGDKASGRLPEPAQPLLGQATVFVRIAPLRIDLDRFSAANTSLFEMPQLIERESQVVEREVARLLLLGIGRHRLPVEEHGSFKVLVLLHAAARADEKSDPSLLIWHQLHQRMEVPGSRCICSLQLSNALQGGQHARISRTRFQQCLFKPGCRQSKQPDALRVGSACETREHDFERRRMLIGERIDHAE